MMKKAFVIVLLFLFLVPFSFGLAEDTVSVITVNFPEYDLARTLCGDFAEIIMLLPPGSESHQYEPTPQDLIRIAGAKLFLYNGGESDSWAESILQSFASDAPASFRMIDSVQLEREEASASMIAVEKDAEDDEHVWTSPKNMMLIARDLCSCLCELFPEHGSELESSLNGYLRELMLLDEAITELVANGKRDLLVFGDRFPFRYFTRDYHLRYDAAFPGCSEDTEPNVNTVISLVKLIQQEKIPVVLTIEFSSGKTADILCEETGAVRRTFHSCHNVTKTELENGVTYLQLMWKNVEVLREALN